MIKHAGSRSCAGKKTAQSYTNFYHYDILAIIYNYIFFKHHTLI
jgi:hypothetical protein